MKRTLAILLIICTVLSVACTTTSPPPPVDASAKRDRLLIGFSMATFKEERWLRDRNIFTAKAKDAGFDVIVKNANNNADRQYNQVLELLDKGIDVLVIAPHDAADAKRAVRVAKQQSVPVISYDRLIEDADIDIYVSFDNVRVGQLMARYMLSEVPTGGYLLLNGSRNDNNSAMFREGYLGELQDDILANRIDLVAESWIDDWRKEAAYDFTYQTLLRDGERIRAIIAANDSLAWAAIDALAEQQLDDVVKVVGHDADLAACRRIAAGSQLMTVYKPIPALVDETIRLCSRLARDQAISADDSIDNGYKAVPYIKIDVIAVHKANIEATVIKDGFHLYEDIYGKTKNVE